MHGALAFGANIADRIKQIIIAEELYLTRYTMCPHAVIQLLRACVTKPLKH